MSAQKPDGASPSTSHETDVERRIAELEEALGLALGYLGLHEPGDSRAVSDEFVSMLAVQCGGNLINDKCREIIRDASTKLNTNYASLREQLKQFGEQVAQPTVAEICDYLRRSNYSHAADIIERKFAPPSPEAGQ